MTYEINLAKKQQEGEDKKKKSITLKATTKEEENEDLALIIRKFNKFMRGERFRRIRLTFRRDISKNESSFPGDKER